MHRLDPVAAAAREFAAAQRVYVSIDLETTGLDANKDRIIEIGAVRFRGDEVLDTFSQLVDPGCPIPARITQITSIRTADVAGKPRPQGKSWDLGAYELPAGM